MAMPSQSTTSSSSITSSTEVVSMAARPLAPSLSSSPLTLLLEAISRIKTLLDSIFGKSKEGEILMVLGVSGSDKFTVINFLVNRIMQESL
ncbi:hypothetical protein BHE74_00001345 [Ensete ventricosum]|nr:hypothetical protein GW17_00009408 [Ensete ventricosum]RWW89660.1 hypothetical protein BHE74_00001345 [Ensete ventricosum]